MGPSPPARFTVYRLPFTLHAFLGPVRDLHTPHLLGGRRPGDRLHAPPRGRRSPDPSGRRPVSGPPRGGTGAECTAALRCPPDRWRGPESRPHRSFGPAPAPG